MIFGLEIARDRKGAPPPQPTFHCWEGGPIPLLPPPLLTLRPRWQVFLRGSKIRFMVLPDMLKNAPMFKLIGEDAQGRGRGVGYGRAPMGRTGWGGGKEAGGGPDRTPPPTHPPLFGAFLR